MVVREDCGLNGWSVLPGVNEGVGVVSWGEDWDEKGVR